MELRYCGTESVAVSLLPDRELIVHTGEVVEATDAEAKKLERSEEHTSELQSPD